VDWTIGFPDIGNVLGGLLVRERREHPSRLDRAGSMVASREYTLEPMGPGLYVIAPIELLISEGEGEYGISLASDPIPVMVGSLLPEGPSQPDLLDMIVLARLTQPWVKTSLLTAAVFAAAGAVLLFRRRRKRRAHGGDTDGSVWFVREASALLSDGLVEKESYRLLYERMSWILRRYLAGQSVLNAAGLTTEEISHALGSLDTPLPRKETLTEIIARCDRVKFTGYTPTREQAYADIHHVKDIIGRGAGDESDKI
jgi:hypothetical protein